MKTKIQEQIFIDDENSNLQFAKHLRLAMGQNVKLASGHETLQKAMDEIIETEIWVPTTHDGKYDVQVHIYTPKYMTKNSNNHACIREFTLTTFQLGGIT